MTRFDCPEYVRAWQNDGKFPAIHDGIFALLTEKVDPSMGAVLDLGSSTGLLSRRMADAGFTVFPLEGSRAAITAGREAGIYDGLEVTRTRILPGDMRDTFPAWLASHNITIVMARRVFPELDDYGVHPPWLSRAFMEAEVQHLFVEGRVLRPNAIHRLRSLNDEIKAIGTGWEVESYDGPHRAHLIRA